MAGKNEESSLEIGFENSAEKPKSKKQAKMQFKRRESRRFTNILDQDKKGKG